MTVFADKEGPFLTIPFTNDVGHSWLRLVDADGSYWTYGFWPQTGFDTSNLKADVLGCVHHPDTAHKPTASQEFELTAEEFGAAKADAIFTCETSPKYNLFGLQCTAFVGRILGAAGKAPAGGFGLIWESPNALATWLTNNSLVLSIGVTAAGTRGVGAVSGNIQYTRQFAQVLGNKLRLQGVGQAEVSSKMVTAAAGVGLEITSQRVFLPSIYLFGGGIAGSMASRPDGGHQFGAGLTGGIGAHFNVDEFLMVGVEYNVVKDLVRKDPELQRLVLTAGIKF